MPIKTNSVVPLMPLSAWSNSPDYSVAKTAMIIAKIRTKQQAVNEVLCRAMSCPIGTVNIVRCGED